MDGRCCAPDNSPIVTDGNHAGMLPSKAPQAAAADAAVSEFKGLNAMDAERFAVAHFGAAQLGHKRRSERLVRLATRMMMNPSGSIPQQFTVPAELAAAYRFFSNPRINPMDLLAPHIGLVRQQAASHPMILSIEDDTELDLTHRADLPGVGYVGGGRGLLQHTALAVTPDGKVLGILDLAFHAVQRVSKDETRRQQQARWNISDVWADCVQHIGHWPVGRIMHVGDRHADVFRHLATCVQIGHEFLVRAMHDRYIDGDTIRLWDKLAAQPVLGKIKVQVGKQRGDAIHPSREGREAELTIRRAPVRLSPPDRDPRTKDWAEVSATAIYLVEENPPQHVVEADEVVEWMLLTSVPAEDLESVLQVVQWYRYRWIIEEWHRAYKQGCRVELSQLDDADDIKRLASILAVGAVYLLQLRDLASPGHPQAEDPAALRQLLPSSYIQAVAVKSGLQEMTLTPRRFFLEVAKMGGYMGRRRDPRPGWIALWRGWQIVRVLAEGVEIGKKLGAAQGKRCV